MKQIGLLRQLVYLLKCFLKLYRVLHSFIGSLLKLHYIAAYFFYCYIKMLQLIHTLKFNFAVCNLSNYDENTHTHTYIHVIESFVRDSVLKRIDNFFFFFLSAGNI